MRTDGVTEEIKRLHDLAREVFPDRRSQRYVEIAQRLAMRHELSLPKEVKRSICGECHAFLVPGSNCTVRIRDGTVVCTCHECGAHRRIPTDT